MASNKAVSSDVNQQRENQVLASRRCHPLQLLSNTEIESASTLLLQHIRKEDERSRRRTKVHFKNISLHEPPKALLLPYLDAEAGGTPLEQRPYVPRCVSLLRSTFLDSVYHSKRIVAQLGGRHLEYRKRTKSLREHNQLRCTVCICRVPYSERTTWTK